MPVTFEVHIVTRARPDLFRKCLSSVLYALGKKDLVYVWVNGECRETVNALSAIKDNRLHWKVTPRLPRAAARNLMFETDAEYLYCLDDDVIVPKHLFERARVAFEKNPRTAILGGPNLTPPDSSYLQKLFGAALCSFFAAPMVRARYRSKLGETLGETTSASEHQLILCNLAFRKSVLPKDLRFENEMKSNEENLFLHRCKEADLSALWRADLFVYHYRRSTLRLFLQQVFTYGHGRFEQTWHEPKSLHPAFLAPSLCLVLLPWLLNTFWMSLYFVGAALGAISAKEIRRLGPAGVASCFLLTPLIHASYGAGFLNGMGKTLSEGILNLARSMTQGVSIRAMIRNPS